MTSIALDRFDAIPVDKARMVFGARRYEIRSRALWGGLIRQKPRWLLCIRDDGSYIAYRMRKRSAARWGSSLDPVSRKFAAAIYHACRIQHGYAAVKGLTGEEAHNLLYSI